MHHPADADLKFVRSARPVLAPASVAQVLEQRWGLRGALADVGGDRDQNLVLTAADGGRHLVKIGQANEDPGVIDMQLAALRHVAARDPGLAVPAVIPARDGAWTHALAAPGGGSHRLRVFTWLPGRPASGSARPAAFMRGAGAMLARLDRALRGFFHPHAEHALLWDIRQAPAIRVHAREIADPARRDRVLGILDAFVDTVLPRLHGLRAQVIHADATADNVLAAGEPPVVSGLIDFGDAVHGPLAQELAVAMADIPWGLADPWSAACELAAGFDERMPLELDELALLWDLARARLALTAAVLAGRAAHRAEGTGSMAGLVEPCWRQLEALDALGRARALAQLRRAVRAPEPVALPPAGDGEGSATTALLARRRQRLLPGLALAYPEAPLHAVRAEGMWLIDAAGRRHLDCYNNVPHVGHGHPHVVNAVARQSAALNTNTRYLYDSLGEYGERLAALLPGALGVTVLVSSGSEATDLAWRIATACTGARGAVVTAGAYHGNTEAGAALSPYHRDALPAHVRTIAAPDDYRGPHRRGEPDLGARYAADAERAIAALDAAGHGVAACMVDPGFASDGIRDAPAGYLAGVFERVRAAGGLCIADEVQAGFGRLGPWWGFETHGVVPDIVTLGKPAANGYPLGAVVTTPAIIDAFARRGEYFSTFGGNPVACMAGLALIDVVEREDLRSRAAEVGAYLRGRLDTLAQRHALVGDVRGRGLLLGVELVRDRATREPAADDSARIVLAMRRAGVLVGIEGAHANVLKIRPPMICERRHADILVDTLERALASA